MSSKKVMDMTRGPVLSQMTKFAVPVLFGMVFQKIYNFADAYIVGHYLGDEALAAVSICGTVMFMLFSINAGISTGVGVVISQFFGATGIWMAWPISWAIATVLSVTFYCMGTWKKHIETVEVIE